MLFFFIYSYVFIAMQALDELLLACHAQSLNLFVESFLKMVHKLLESNNTDLQILGTSSVSIALIAQLLNPRSGLLNYVHYPVTNNHGKKSCILYH